MYERDKWKKRAYICFKISTEWFLYWFLKVSFCVLRLKETSLPKNTINIYWGKPVSFNSNTQKLLLTRPSEMKVSL